tara:strand:+ start:306 stop:1340 length:1035 start_codon:yes stop_codon:yes gene_type:complete
MINYKENLIKQDENIHLALEKLESLNHKILFVVNNQLVLQGTITDGDIRRKMITSGSSNFKCFDLMNTNCFYSYEEDISNSKRLAIKKGIKIFPIVDKNKIIIGSSEASEFVRQEKSNTVIIMAGGKGKRLMPLTKNLPKPLIEVGEKTILLRIMEKCKKEGFDNIVISLGYLSDLIVDYVERLDFDHPIKFIYEKEPLGTSGSLAQLIDDCNINYPILVTNGDIICEANFADLIDRAENDSYDGIMLAKRQTITVPFGVIEEQNGEWKGISEKPSYNYSINAGVYVLSKKMLNLIKKNEYLDMTNLFQRASDQKMRLGVEYIDKYWIDIGRHETLQSANTYFS